MADAFGPVEVHALRILQTEVQAEAPPRPPAPTPTPQTPQCLDELRHLREALARNDMQAYVLWREIRTVCEPAMDADRFKALNRCIESFDFDAAAQRLDDAVHGLAS